VLASCVFRSLVLAYFQVREARPYSCSSFCCQSYCCVAILWLVCYYESIKCLGVLYGIVGVTNVGKTVTEACVLAQASLYRPGETCRGRPEPHSSSRLNEASHSGERGSLKRERVRALARRCGF